MSRYVKKYPDFLTLFCPGCGTEYLYKRASRSGITYNLDDSQAVCSCGEEFEATEDSKRVLGFITCSQSPTKEVENG